MLMLTMAVNYDAGLWRAYAILSAARRATNAVSHDDDVRRHVVIKFHETLINHNL